MNSTSKFSETKPRQDLNDCTKFIATNIKKIRTLLESELINQKQFENSVSELVFENLPTKFDLDSCQTLLSFFKELQNENIINDSLYEKISDHILSKSLKDETLSMGKDHSERSNRPKKKANIKLSSQSVEMKRTSTLIDTKAEDIDIKDSIIDATQIIDVEIESVEIVTTNVGFGKRLVAYILDFLIFVAFSFCLGIILTLLNLITASTSEANLTILSYVFAIAYWVGMWVYADGATYGKKILGIKIVKTDGSPLTFGTALGRYIGYIISGLPLGLGFLSVCWNKNKQGWHDKMANTKVVSTR